MIDYHTIATLPPPGYQIPQRCMFSPDGRSIAYLWAPQGGLLKDLWLWDLRAQTVKCLVNATHGLVDENDLSLTQQLARERDRERGLGITRFTFQNDTALLVESGHTLMSIGSQNGDILWTYTHKAPVFLATFSPDGHTIAFVSEGDVYTIPFRSSSENTVRLTADATDNRLNGIADQMTWEEFGRKRGFWWLNDNRHLLVAAVTLTQIPLTHIASPDQRQAETHHYPFAGAPLPVNELFLIDITTGFFRPADISFEGYPYLIDVTLHPDGSPLIQLLSRCQQKLKILRLDTQTLATDLLLTEEIQPWLNTFPGIHFIPQDHSLLRLHERKAITRIERRDAKGVLLNDIAAPQGMIHGILGLDAFFVYFSAAHDDPRERHLFKAPWDGSGAVEQLTQEPGWHAAILSPDKKTFIHYFDNITTPPRITLDTLDARIAQPFPNVDPLTAIEKYRPPELLTFPSKDGKAHLYGALYRPPGATPEKLPLVVAVYGGPHHQAVQNTWALTVDLRAQHFIQQGYCVLKVDNRGTWGRGLAFETPINRRLGQTEVADQVAGVRYVIDALKIADGRRVGIYGWSYGGYMALMCLLQHPEIFRGAVAGAPVIQWEEYDAAYTERYMGLPVTRDLQEPPNTTGYQAASILTHLPRLTRKVCVIHGTQDENVLFKHTLLLLKEANRLFKAIDVLLIPGERHSIRNFERRVLIEKKVFAFLEQALSDKPDP